MIHAYIRGRLGNQLFQYAFIRLLQHYNPGVKAIYHFDEVYSAGTKEQDFINALGGFKTVGVNEENNSPKLNLIQRIALRLYFSRFPHSAPIDVRTKYQMRWVKCMERVGLYYLDLGYYNFKKQLPNHDVIVTGNFESERYFKEIASHILQEVKPIKPLSLNNQKLADLMHNTNSVSLSIRRGDFVDNPEVNNLHNVCTKTYYRNAVEYIKQHVDNPVLFIFSNDIQWVKDNIDFGLESYYESGNDPSWETLELMSNCKHFIISNSSFNWWAQYKGTYEGKIVVAPERWFNNPLIPDIFLDTWVKLPVS